MWWIPRYGFSKFSILTLGTNSEGQGQISQPRCSCPPRPRILLWTLNMIDKKLWEMIRIRCFWLKSGAAADVWCPEWHFSLTTINPATSDRSSKTIQQKLLNVPLNRRHSSINITNNVLCSSTHLTGQLLHTDCRFIEWTLLFFFW